MEVCVLLQVEAGVWRGAATAPDWRRRLHNYLPDYRCVLITLSLGHRFLQHKNYVLYSNVARFILVYLFNMLEY